MTCSQRNKTSPSPCGPMPTSVEGGHMVSDGAFQEPSQNTPGNPSAPTELKLKKGSATAVFDIGARYRIKKLVGQGAFGCVVSGEKSCGTKVAIKKVANATADKTAAKRLLREIRFLRHLRGHPNVVSVEDIVVRRSSPNSKLDVYIVTELMEADLEQIIKSSQALSPEHVRCLIFQLLNGLRHMHSAGIVHRDLKPANLVVDSQCRLKICDLGLSRHITDPLAVPPGVDAKFTDYVVTRWYRAPELLMGCKSYTAKVDMWAAGCILAELINRKPLFVGDNTSDMLVRIAGKIGKPSKTEVHELSEEPAAKTFVLSIPEKPLRPLQELFPSADAGSIDLLSRLLVWTPERRASVDAALQLPYLKDLWEPPAVLRTDHMELAQISQGNIPTWKVLDLVCSEAAFWRGSGAHCRVFKPKSCGAPFACLCGQNYGSGASLLAHLDPQSASHEDKMATSEDEASSTASSSSWSYGLV
mmetsp:Transcript_21191/g.50141  ORF Transcript_21191/g.50141 Transcript_21191/m.50141 type:complete len:473 (+) Transcript_21191:238-1656(+)